MADRLSGLSEEQRKLLEKKLRQKKMEKLRGTENAISHNPENSKEYQISYNQESIWFVNRLYENNTIYNIGGIAKIKGNLNVDVFEECFRHLVKKHDILRTVFYEKNQEAIAKVLEIYDFSVERVYLTGGQDEVEALIKLHRDFPFDLENEAAYRVVVAKLGEEDWMILLIIHHILSDGTSTQIIFRELIDYYETSMEGRQVSDNQVSITYGDFATWQNKLRKEKWHPDYWKERLANTEFKLDFFEQCTKLNQIEDKSVRIPFEIHEDMLGQMTHFAKERNITVFSILLGSFYLALYKYSGQESLVTGVLTSGRDNTSIANLIGCFIGVVPFQMKIDKNMTVEQFFMELYKQFMEDFQHKEELAVYENESMKHQILFSYEEDPENDIKIKGLQMSFEEVEGLYCRSEVELELNKLNGMIRGWLNYRENLFERSYMEQFVNHYRVILGIVTKNPKITIKELEMVEGEERKRILGFNPETSFYERNATIPEIFAKIVDQYPEKTALYMDKEQMSYQELDQKSGQIAVSLIEKGVVVGDRIAITCGREFDLICGLLGILKAGAAYVPIDEEVPAARREFMMQDSEVKYLLLDRMDRISTQEEIKVPMILIGDCYRDVDDCRPQTAVTPDHTAYIIYTSGTTGTPKGVVVNHRNVLQTMRNVNYLDYRENDRLIGLASYAFDASVFDVFFTILNGAGLVLVSKELLLDIPRLVDEIEQKDVTVMFITTALFNALIDIKPQGLRKLRRILFGGERASSVHVRKAIDVLGDGVVVNMYGPTESTVYATYCDIQDEMFTLESLPIGKPTSNTTVMICNKDGNLNPVGVKGELIIGGEGIADGYLHREDLTKEKFFEDGEHNRFYRTGDIGKWTADGNILYCARVDDQVKYRGFRIELGEIEKAILSYPEVERVFVIFDKDEKIGAYLCAYLVTKENYALDTLKKELRKKLPSYMIPNYFVEMEELPLNQNGKVDKKKLPKPDLHVSKDYVAPTTEQEEIMAEIWSEVLGMEKVGITDHFFEIGGHSIKVAKMCALVQEKMEISIPLRVVFQYPTIQELCAYLNKKGGITKIENIYKIEDASHYETSKTQKRMVFAYELNPESVSYNIPFAVRIFKNVKAEQIETAINQLIETHEILRTRFRMEEGSVYQIVERAYQFQLDVVETEQSIEAYFEGFIKPFRLDRLPLFRMQIVKTWDGESYLLGDFHHSIFDGVSMQVFLEELSDLYRGGNCEKPYLQYRDYAKWHNDFLASNYVKEQGAFWKARYEIWPETKELPLDYQRPAIKTGKGEILYFNFEEEQTEKIRNLAKRHQTTMHVVLMSMFHLMLRHYTGCEDVVVGTPVAGRRQQSVQRMLGMFLNTLAIRSYPISDKTVWDYIEEMKQEWIEGFDHQDYPFEQLVEELQIKRQANRNPLFDTLFIMQNGVSWEFDFGDTKFQLCDLNYKTSKFDLQMEVYEEEKTLKCLIAYADDLFMQSTIEMFIETYKQIAEKVCENEDCLLGDLMVADEEDMELVGAFADDLFE